MDIIKLRYGNTNTYFINGILFDTDMPGTMSSLFKALKSSGISISDIKYVLASHYHPDHIGLVSELMEIGVKLIIISNQLEYIHFSDEILKRQRGNKYQSIDEEKAVIITPEESRLYLKSIGISGEIVTTFSHSSDGIALILDNGDCFVGDLEPKNYIDAYKNNTALEKDWASIMSYSPRLVHYGHMNDQIL